MEANGPHEQLNDPTESSTLQCEPGVRLRLSWGGGEARQWSGTISVTTGEFSNVSILGLTADAPGSIVHANGEILVNHWTPTTFGGVDLTVSEVEDASLNVVLFPTDQPEKRFEQLIAISKISSETYSEDLDLFANRLSIARVPGDRLTVHFRRDHLVFSPGEELDLGVQANRTGWTARRTNCRLRLMPDDRRSNGFRWSNVIAPQLDQSGTSPIEWTRVTAPPEEGVYELEIELESGWHASSFNRLSEVKRVVQIIVIAPKIPVLDEPWNPFTTVDPTDAKPVSLFTLGQLPRFSGISTKPIGNEFRRNISVDQRQMLELLPGGWQAIPIAVDRINRPHLMEIEFLADKPTAIGFSLLQPDATGQIPLYGFDSGVVVPDSIVETSPATADGRVIHRHRIVFWPQIKQPYLLVANRDRTRPAAIGKIQIYSGPNRLPGTKTETGLDHSPIGLRRKFMAFYESPLFPENFGAMEQVDPNVGQPFDDWRMFYEGADRFVQYLKANSYRGAFVTVACDGSAIYPSQLLGLSPKHDSGTFFTNGQDPMRKDVLEMLFRMFDREGLILVPSLAMSAPLPAIEQLRIHSNSREQIDLVNFNRDTAPRQLTNSLPIYNPLNRQVQKAVTDVVDELAQRYQTHESFDGIGIVCRPDTYTLLPGRQWGYDAMTARQFMQSQPDFQNIPDSDEDIRRLLLTTHLERWIQWCARQMSYWYESLLQTVKRSNPAGHLYIAPVDIYRNEEINAALSPSLHSSFDFHQQMLQLGLETDVFSLNPQLELLRPQRIAPNESLAANRVEINLALTRDVEEFYASADSTSDLFTHRISWAHFAQLQEQNPFGQPQSAPIMRLQQLTPSAHCNRERFLEALRIHDSRLLVDGGWMMAMGQEQALEELVSIFTQLPDIAFTEVNLPESLSRFKANSMPVIVRQGQAEGKSFFYAINVSPWPVQVQIDSDATIIPAGLVSLSQAPITTHGEHATQIQFDIEPLGIVGGYSGTPVNFTEYRFEIPAAAGDTLRKHVYSLQAKLIKSTKVQPMAVLNNPDFELHDQPSMYAWDFGKQSTAKIRLDTQQAYHGRVALTMQNNESEAVWIRSNTFEPPSTGRLSVSVWLRTEHPESQPPLRLSVEGKIGEINYYRFGSVGGLSSDNQIGKRWQRFAVHFDDLPVERISDLRIGFDLMGPGQVQLDQVEVYDRWFDENDAKAITQRIASCGPLLGNPATFENCRRLLKGYWLRFLDENFADEESSQAAASGETEPPVSASAGPPAAKPKVRRIRSFGNAKR